MLKIILIAVSKQQTFMNKEFEDWINATFYAIIFFAWIVLMIYILNGFKL